jgi:uncharacterized protein
MDSQKFSTSEEVLYTNVSSDERTLAILCHVLSIFFWLFPPLIIYLVKKDESPYVAAHAKEAMNFQLSLLIYSMVAAILVLLLIGFLLLFAIYIGGIVLCIIATIKATENKLYKYPFCIRLIS